MAFILLKLVLQMSLGVCAQEIVFLMPQLFHVCTTV